MDITTNVSGSDREALVQRIRAEYVEMPGMHLRLEQVARLCGIERSVCQTLLDALVEVNFLFLKTDGTYSRLADDVRLARAVDGADPGAARRLAGEVMTDQLRWSRRGHVACTRH